MIALRWLESVSTLGNSKRTYLVPQHAGESAPGKDEPIGSRLRFTTVPLEQLHVSDNRPTVRCGPFVPCKPSADLLVSAG